VLIRCVGFFDLVFVFVITQVTQLEEYARGTMDFLRALLVPVPIWWMYAGYAWLTNNVGANWRMHLVLIAAMAGFFTMDGCDVTPEIRFDGKIERADN